MPSMAVFHNFCVAQRNVLNQLKPIAQNRKNFEPALKTNTQKYSKRVQRN